LRELSRETGRAGRSSGASRLVAGLPFSGDILDQLVNEEIVAHYAEAA
jgi:hypothetical protein